VVPGGARAIRKLDQGEQSGAPSRSAAGGSGLDIISTVRLDQIRTVDRSRLIKKLGRIDAGTATAVLDVLREMFEP